MTFGEAIEALKLDQRVARQGWNGKGMWLALLRPHGGAAAWHPKALGIPVSPCIGMKTAGGDMQPGWLASQADMLAEDWVIVIG